MDVQKQLELMLQMEKLDQAIREAALQEQVRTLSPVEEKLERVRLIRDGRILAGKKRAAKNKAKKRHRAKQKRYCQRQEVKRWELAANGDWWPKLKETWRKRKLNVTLTEAEWNIHVSEHIPEGVLFNVNRHDTSKGISLENICVTDSNRNILFDGASQEMLG